MKLKFFICIIILLSAAFVAGKSSAHDFKNGDIIFHESWAPQAKFIKLATHSKYSHVGIVFKFNNKFYVLEAAARVKISKLKTFISRGVGKRYVIKRLKNYDSLMNKKTIKKLKRISKSFLGKRYDYYFEWNDKRLYSSELIWKIYSRGLNIKLGKMQKLKEFDFSDPYVYLPLMYRFGDDIPMDEIVISPDSIFNSTYLYTIFPK